MAFSIHPHLPLVDQITRFNLGYRLAMLDLRCKNMIVIENDGDWFDTESVKQYLGLHGGRKPPFSTMDRSQKVVQNGYVLVTIAECNVVQF